MKNSRRANERICVYGINVSVTRVDEELDITYKVCNSGFQDDESPRLELYFFSGPSQQDYEYSMCMSLSCKHTKVWQKTV